MKLLLYKIKLMFKFYKWYKTYVKNGMKPTVAFCGYTKEYIQFRHENPQLKVKHIRNEVDVLGREFDFFMIYYGNKVGVELFYQLKSRSNLLN